MLGGVPQGKQWAVSWSSFGVAGLVGRVYLLACTVLREALARENIRVLGANIFVFNNSNNYNTIFNSLNYAARQGQPYVSRQKKSVRE